MKYDKKTSDKHYQDNSPKPEDFETYSDYVSALNEFHLRLAHWYLGVAAKHLCLAGSRQEVSAVHTIMDIVQYDHAELIETYFPIVSKK